MAQAFHSLEEALAFFDQQLMRANAEALAAKVLAATALQLLCEDVDRSAAAAALSRELLANAAFEGGDDGLNEELRAAAADRVAAILASFETANRH